MADDGRLPGGIEDPRAVETTAWIRYSVVAELMVVRSRGLATAALARWPDVLAPWPEPLVVPSAPPGLPAAPPRGPGVGPLELPAESAPDESDDRHWTDQGL